MVFRPTFGVAGSCRILGNRLLVSHDTQRTVLPPVLYSYCEPSSYIALGRLRYLTLVYNCKRKLLWPCLFSSLQLLYLTQKHPTSKRYHGSLDPSKFLNDPASSRVILFNTFMHSSADSTSGTLRTCGAYVSIYVAIVLPISVAPTHPMFCSALLLYADGLLHLPGCITNVVIPSSFKSDAHFRTSLFIFISIEWHEEIQYR